MKNTAADLAQVRSNGLYITKQCDRCGKLLNQTVCYIIAGRPEVFCSAECRDVVFFGDFQQGKKHAASRICSFCGIRGLPQWSRLLLWAQPPMQQLHAFKRVLGGSELVDSVGALFGFF